MRWLGCRELLRVMIRSSGLCSGTVSERALHFLDFVKLQRIAGLDVLEVGAGDAASGAALHLLHLVLEAPQAGHRAVVDHSVVAQNAHMDAAPFHARGNNSMATGRERVSL